MTPEERFQHERRAFRDWIAGKDECELQHLTDDIRLRQAYLQSIKPENIIKGLTVEE